jgi:hypothetical protein
MKFLPTTVGAEPKKIAILGGLVVVLGGVYWMNRTDSDAPASAPSPAAVAPVVPKMPAVPQRTQASPGGPRRSPANSGSRVVQDFRPSLKLPEGMDISRIDPSLRLDLLAKARSAEGSGGSRSLFEFGQAPAPPPPPVKAVVPTAPPKPADDEAKAATPPGPPKPPPPPPITLKFYGYAGTAQSGQRRAFFLDGEDIFVAGENELVRGRYKIIRIGVNSAVVEDTVNKNQQTLPLVEELA